MMKCYEHPENEAVGMCTECGKTICDVCKLEVDEKLICKKCVQKKMEKQIKKQEETETIEKSKIVNRELENWKKTNWQLTPHRKGKNEAGVMALLGGWFGLHKFYLNKPGQGIAMALFSSTGIPLIISIYEGAVYLTSTQEEFDKKYNREYYLLEQGTEKEKIEFSQTENYIHPPHMTDLNRMKNNNKKIIDIETDLIDDLEQEKTKIEKTQETLEKKETEIKENMKNEKKEEGKKDE